MATSPRDQYVNNLLRGIAILAVIVIHAQGSIPGGFSISSPTWRYFVFSDQLSRICVPLFVALSGYGFWQKYLGGELKAWDFIYHQAKKLLPMYIVASIVCYTILYFVYYRHTPGPAPSFWYELFTGQADYQLYFVPMIFQFYLLFPWLRLLVKKFRWTSLGAAAIFQAILYSVSTRIGSDQAQYVWFFTWIFYFILGMHLSEITSWVIVRARMVWTLTALALVTWISISFMAIGNMLAGLDPIIALRFTRVEMLVYANFVIIFLFVVSYRASERFQFLTRPVSRLGNYSYPIYLFHTMVLRAIFAFI